MSDDTEAREGAWLVKFKRLTNYPTYIDDPDGLERIRMSLLAVRDWHDMPGRIINCNSLAWLLDTIEYQRAAITTALRHRDEARALALEEAARLVRKRSNDYRADVDADPNYWSEARAISNVLWNLDPAIRALHDKGD